MRAIALALTILSFGSAQAVGFGAPALRHHFRKSLATTPQAYRARFGGSPRPIDTRSRL